MNIDQFNQLGVMARAPLKLDEAMLGRIAHKGSVYLWEPPFCASVEAPLCTQNYLFSYVRDVAGHVCIIRGRAVTSQTTNWFQVDVPLKFRGESITASITRRAAAAAPAERGLLQQVLAELENVSTSFYEWEATIEIEEGRVVPVRGTDRPLPIFRVEWEKRVDWVAHYDARGAQAYGSQNWHCTPDVVGVSAIEPIPATYVSDVERQRRLPTQHERIACYTRTARTIGWEVWVRDPHQSNRSVGPVLGVAFAATCERAESLFDYLRPKNAQLVAGRIGDPFIHTLAGPTR